jgi:hypothetical protein
MADPDRVSILAGGMGFSPSLAGVIAAVALSAASASAGAIPGPPLVSSVDEQAGAFCPLRGSTAGHGAGFAAAGIALLAIAARRREPAA